MGIQNSEIVFTKRGDLGRTPTFWQTDASLTHRFKFGNEGRFTIAFDLNILNLFNNNTVTSFDTYKYADGANSNFVGFGDVDSNYPSTEDPVVALNRILNGQFTPQMVDAAIAGSGVHKNVLWGRADGYQAARNVRFGVRFFF